MSIYKRKHCNFIKVAINEANKSLMTKKHGCVIVHNNSILSKGYNYRVYKTTKSHTKYSIHAEESAILKLNSLRATKTLQTLNMYVVRIQDNELRLSLPCKKCTELINKNKNLNKIYYTFDN